MLKDRIYRNANARDLLDAFLVSAITTVLLVRFYLHITGYPQLGGGSLHIAHMLYGGLFMLAALVVSFSFIGIRSRQIAAVFGGIGFGLFIDELGKFITKDNDYFFEPTIGLIYAVFVVLYLGFNFLSRAQRLTPRESQLNALIALEEALAEDMDRAEKAKLYALLEDSDPSDPITKQLKSLVDTIEIQPSRKAGPLTRFLKKTDKAYRRFWQQRGSNALIKVLFTAQVILLVAAIFYTIYTSVDDISHFFDGQPSYGEQLIIGQVLSSAAAAGFVVYGLTQLGKSRIAAFEQFRRAALINIYLTQFFVFVRLEFQALPGFLINLVLLLLISFVLAQEARLGKRYAQRK